MISTSGITLQYGKKVLFEKVSINFTPGNCYGLIGANGAGKTTFLKILSGQEEATEGEIQIQNGKKLGTLSQNQFAYENNTIQKQFRGTSIGGKINNKANIKREGIVNNKLVFSRTIQWSTIASSELLLWIWDFPIGNAPISNQNEVWSWLVVFKRVIDYNNLRATGETITFRFSGNDIWQDFVLDYLDTTLLIRGHRYDKSYKI